MPHFIIVFLWLVGLVVCGVMALFKPFRRLAIHLALMGTLAVILSFVLSLALGVALAAPFRNTEFSGLVFLGGFVLGFGLGGLLGLILGHWLGEKIAPLGLWRRLRQGLGGGAAV